MYFTVLVQSDGSQINSLIKIYSFIESNAFAMTQKTGDAIAIEGLDKWIQAFTSFKIMEIRLTSVVIVCRPIGHENVYPKMHYPRQTQSMIAHTCIIMTEYFWKFQ